MAKRKKEEEEHDEFIVLFTALSMILLAFFILLNTMAVIDPMRSQKAMDSLVGTFGLMNGNQDGENIELSAEEQHDKMVMALIAEFKNDGRYAGMNIDIKANGSVQITMDTEVFFSSGSWHLDPARFAALDRIASLVQDDTYTLRVVGHTDAKKSAKTSNVRLSAARAASVRRYLEHAMHYPPGKIHSTGVGSSQLHPEHRTRPGDPRHRRVEIFIDVPDQSTSTPPL